MTLYEQLARKLDCALRPIDTWPGKLTGWRRSSSFRADWLNTTKLLAKELDAIDAKERVIQVAISRGNFRQDGFPRADVKRHEHPGVILSFTKGRRPLSFPCDTYDDWKDNVRAIGLALEALRAVDRYGVTRNEEQYAGWTAIEAPKPAGFASVDEAARWIGEVATKLACGVYDFTQGRILGEFETLQMAYRIAAKRLHPDTGGSHEQFTKLQEAKALLDAHHGKAA